MAGGRDYSDDGEIIVEAAFGGPYANPIAERKDDNDVADSSLGKSRRPVVPLFIAASRFNK